jgi:ribonuclease P protein component
LTRREDYVAAAKGRRFHLPTLSLQAAERRSPSPDGEAGHARFGLTVSRKVGNAVVRNRVKRRLRHAVRCIEDGSAARPGLLPQGLPAASFDYVVVARPEALSRSFENLVEDLAAGIAGAHQRRAARPQVSDAGPSRPAHRRRGRAPLPSETR